MTPVPVSRYPFPVQNLTGNGRRVTGNDVRRCPGA